MHGVLVPLILVLLASVAVIVGTVVFFGWAAQYFGRRAYRQATRRHLYVPVDARVTRVLYHLNSATLYVEYEFGGATIVNRFLTTPDAARLAQRSKQVALQIDPDHPKDVTVDPTFETLATASPKPMPLGATTFAGYALRLVAASLFLPLGGGLYIGLVWVAKGRVDSLLLELLAAFTLTAFLLFNFLGLLLASPRFKARGGGRLDQLEGEKEN